MYKTAIYGYQPSDRNIVIVTDGDQLIGLNYWQGLNEMSIADSFLIPDLMLTGYVVSEIEDDVESHGLSFENPNSELLNFIDDAIWKYFDKSNEQRIIKLPKSQTELIRDAVEFYRNALNQMSLTDEERHYESDEESHYRDFDLMTLNALLSYDVSVTLTESQVDRFTAKHGIDFPEYVS